MVGVLLFKYKITSSFRACCTSWVLCVGNGVTARAAPCSRLPGPHTGARGAAGGQQPLGVRGARCCLPHTLLLFGAICAVSLAWHWPHVLLQREPRGRGG